APLEPYRHDLALHSVPTRRSSDLIGGISKIHIQRQFQPAAERCAVDGAKHRYGAIGHGQNGPLNQQMLRPPGVIIHGVALLQIRSEEHTSELQSRENLVCRLLLEK